MNRKRVFWAISPLVLLTHARAAAAQDQPAQYPRFLANSYIGVQLGYIDYPFSSSQVQPGFHAQSIQVPHLAARVFLFGHEFSKYVSAQISDMRPVYWVKYQNVNGDQGSHSVWMNVAGLTAKSRLPLTRTLSVLFGGGLDYHVSDNRTLLTGVTAALGRSVDRQPRTLFFSGGFTYTVRRLPAEPVETDTTSVPVWPKNILQLGYMTDALGFGAND